MAGRKCFCILTEDEMKDLKEKINAMTADVDS